MPLTKLDLWTASYIRGDEGRLPLKVIASLSGLHLGGEGVESEHHIQLITSVTSGTRSI